jgi:hypothetical protein
MITNDYEIGETVIVHKNYSEKDVGLVQKISPTGLITVLIDGNLHIFNKNGMKRGHNSFYRWRISKWKANVGDDIIKKKKVKEILSFFELEENYLKMSEEDLDTIQKMVDKHR